MGTQEKTSEVFCINLGGLSNLLARWAHVYGVPTRRLSVLAGSASRICTIRAGLLARPDRVFHLAI
jgi:hypothetical protein